MPFIPDTVYGIAYVLVLIAAGAITLLGQNTDARRILWVLIAHWLTTRAIDVYDHTNFLLWIAQDCAVFLAMLFYCRGIAGRACAALFFIVLSFDNYSYLTSGTFEGAAAVAETVGYLAMIIMAGGAYGNRGKRSGYSIPVSSGTGSVLVTGKGEFPPQGRA